MQIESIIAYHGSGRFNSSANEALLMTLAVCLALSSAGLQLRIDVHVASQSYWCCQTQLLLQVCH